MLYMLVNRTRTDLSSAERTELADLAQGFYESVPAGLGLIGDWAACDGSRTFSLLETDDAALLERVQEPFRRFVDIEIVPVEEVTGWGRR